MNDVFLSYSRKDKKQVEKIAAALESFGLNIWWDSKITIGQAFDITIEEQLENSKCVVVFWSKHSTLSEWVKNESAYAAEKGILLPALLGKTNIPLEFRRKQTVDLSNWNNDIHHENFQKLYFGITSITALRDEKPIYNKKNKTKKKSLIFAVIFATLIIALTSGYIYRNNKTEYNNNLKKILSNLKAGRYSSETAQLIRRNLAIDPYRIDLYRLIAWKKQSLRNSVSNEIFREYTTFITTAIFNGFPSKNNIEFFITNIDFYSKIPENKNLTFDPIPYISQLYTEAAVLKKTPKEDIYLVLKKILENFDETPERSTSIAIVNTEFLAKENNLKKLKENLLNTLNTNAHNTFFNESSISQQGWDHLAQLEIVLCSTNIENKENHIKNISKYYSNVINNRRKALERKPNEIFWLSSPNKLSIYTHITKWNNPIEINEKNNLNIFEQMCPSYEKTLKHSLRKHPDFINEYYISNWNKGTINVGNIFR